MKFSSGAAVCLEQSLVALDQRLEAGDILAEVGPLALSDPLFAVHAAHGLFHTRGSGGGLLAGTLGVAPEHGPRDACQPKHGDQRPDRAAQGGDDRTRQPRARRRGRGGRIGGRRCACIAQLGGRCSLGGDAFGRAHRGQPLPDLGFSGLRRGKLAAQRGQHGKALRPADVIDLGGQARLLELDLAADQRRGRHQACTIGRHLRLSRGGVRTRGRQRDLRRLLLGCGTAHGRLRGADGSDTRGLVGLQLREGGLRGLQLGGDHAPEHHDRKDGGRGGDRVEIAGQQRQAAGHCVGGGTNRLAVAHVVQVGVAHAGQALGHGLRHERKLRLDLVAHLLERRNHLGHGNQALLAHGLELAGGAPHALGDGIGQRRGLLQH